LTRTGYEQIKGQCEFCKREIERNRYNKLSPDQKKEKGKKANKQAQKRRNKQLEFIERQRKILDKQNHRIEDLELRMERARTRYRHVENPDRYVDFVPFRMWLMRQNRLHEYNTTQLAEEIGQDASRVGRWLQGFEWNGAGRDPTPIRSIEIKVVDAIGVAIDDPGLLTRLYPLETADM